MVEPTGRSPWALGRLSGPRLTHNREFAFFDQSLRTPWTRSAVFIGWVLSVQSQTLSFTAITRSSALTKEARERDVWAAEDAPVVTGEGPPTDSVNGFAVSRSRPPIGDSAQKEAGGWGKPPANSKGSSELGSGRRPSGENGLGGRVFDRVLTAGHPRPDFTHFASCDSFRSQDVS